MSPLPPSRRDSTGPPPRNVSDLSKIVRHHDSYLRQLDPGLQGGRFGSPRPVPHGPSQIVGGEDGGGGADDNHASEWDDRHTVVAAGTQVVRLSHIPDEESLHVRWHPRGYGALPITNEFFTVTDQVVTIPAFDGLAVGDTFSFQYEYLIEDAVPELELIATVPGVFDSTTNTLRFTPPPAMEQGDLLVVAARGQVAPGGGDVTLGITSGDLRVTLLFSATLPVVETVLAGFATASTADVVTNVVPNPSYSPGAGGVMGIFRGVNDIAEVTPVEVGTTTPQVSGIAAIAVTWAGNSSFAVVHADPPSGYALAGDTGLDYGATCISYWYDPEADISPAGTFTGEGCLVIGLT